MSISGRNHLIAIVGGSGAGKSWLVEKLCAVLGDRAGHLQLDDFYLDQSALPLAERARINFDEPGTIDWALAENVLLACRDGQRVQRPRYDFATHSRLAEAEEWTPRPLVFVDGLWLLHRPDLRRLFALKIYLDTPSDLRLSRRLERDVNERGYSAAAVTHRFTTDVAPMHDRHVLPQKRWADLVLGQPFREAALHELADRLWALMEAAAPCAPWMHEMFRTELLSLLTNQAADSSRPATEARHAVAYL